MSEIVREWFLKTKDGILVEVQVTKEGSDSYQFSEGFLPPSVKGLLVRKDFGTEEDAYRYVQENYIPGRRTQGWTIQDLVPRGRFEHGDYGDFHVEGENFAEKGWGIKAWRKGLTRNKHTRYAVLGGQFHRVSVATMRSVQARREVLADLGVDPNVDPALKEAVLHVIATWEGKPPLRALT
jgi:hypothetical protein